MVLILSTELRKGHTNQNVQRSENSGLNLEGKELDHAAVETKRNTQAVNKMRFIYRSPYHFVYVEATCRLYKLKLAHTW